jgi:hypothetical protein
MDLDLNFHLTLKQCLKPEPQLFTLSTEKTVQSDNTVLFFQIHQQKRRSPVSNIVVKELTQKGATYSS